MLGSDYVQIYCWRALDKWCLQYSYRVSHGGEPEDWQSSPFVMMDLDPPDLPALFLAISEAVYNLVD